MARCEKHYTETFSPFLDGRKALLATGVLAQNGWDNFRLWGGHEGAERVMLGVFPPYTDSQDFPITPLSLTCRAEDELTHRDFLGATLALGLERETLGDILVEPGRAVIFAAPVAAKLIMLELGLVGRVGVKIAEGFCEPLPGMGRVEEMSGTVSSLRLDCVVAFLTNLSREKAAALIKSGAVNLAYCPCDKVDKQAQEGERITIKGYGRYRIQQILGLSKKGRTRLLVHKSIG